MVYRTAGRIAALSMLACLGACNDGGEGVDGNNAAIVAVGGMPDVRPTARELELQPQVKRFEALTTEEGIASDSVAVTEQDAQKANQDAMNAMAVLESEIVAVGSKEVSGPVSSVLKTFMTPVGGQLVCEAGARSSVDDLYVRELSAAIPARWSMDYSREVDKLMATPGVYAYTARKNIGPQELLIDCAREVQQERVLAHAIAVVDATCGAVASLTPLEKVEVSGGGPRDRFHAPIAVFSAASLKDTVSEACEALGTFAPEHPLMREAASVSDFYETTWNSTMAASLHGRRELAEQMAALATSQGAKAADEVARRDALREELATLAEPVRQYEIEVAARKEREAQAEKVRQQAEAVAARARAETAERERDAREKAWRRAGNKGMSPDARAECEGNAMTMASIRNASTAVAMSRGADAAADWAIQELRKRGISDQCIQHLNQ